MAKAERMPAKGMEAQPKQEASPEKRVKPRYIAVVRGYDESPAQVQSRQLKAIHSLLSNGGTGRIALFVDNPIANNAPEQSGDYAAWVNFYAERTHSFMHAEVLARQTLSQPAEERRPITLDELEPQSLERTEQTIRAELALDEHAQMQHDFSDHTLDSLN